MAVRRRRQSFGLPGAGRPLLAQTAPPVAVAPTVVDEVDLPGNLAALELAMDVGDWLLGMGAPCADVVSIMLDITRRYCPRRVHVDIASTVITLSQARLAAEPLTMIRSATPRALNHSTIQAIRATVADWHRGVPLEEARRRFDATITSAKSYPWWAFTLSSGAVSAGAAALFTPSLRMLLLTFLVGCLAERVLGFLARRGVPAFFRQAAAALVITLSAGALAALSHQGWAWFPPLNPTAIVVGGIVMLVVGLMFVSAVQDAIDAFYVTAAGRLLQVIMLTSSIVVGILVGMYVSKRFGLGILVQPDPLAMAPWPWQVLSAGLIAGAFAAYCQSTRLAVFWSTLTGIFTWAIFLLMGAWGMSSVPSAAIAASVAGLLGTLISTRLRMSEMALTQAGIVMLVPGLLLYSGLMQVVNYAPSDLRFMQGVSTLFTAVAIGLSIAAGSSFGTMIGRPIKRQLRLMRNWTATPHATGPRAVTPKTERAKPECEPVSAPRP